MDHRPGAAIAAEWHGSRSKQQQKADAAGERRQHGGKGRTGTRGRIMGTSRRCEGNAQTSSRPRNIHLTLSQARIMDCNCALGWNPSGQGMLQEDQ